MKHQGYFTRATQLREATQTRRLIADLHRIVDILDVDIATEEGTAGVTDLMRPEYPIIARALRARRNNLLETISVLRQRLEQRPSRQVASRAIVPDLSRNLKTLAATDS